MRKRRYPSIFDAFEGLFRGFPFEEEREEGIYRDPFEDLIRRFQEGIPEDLKELVREEETPGGTSRRYGPFVYGFSYTAEPGKEPTFREFGNIRPSRGGIEPSSGREPLVDVMEDGDLYKIFAELPGVEKENIKLDSTERSVRIETTGEKKFAKTIALDAEVDPDSAKASYKNGVLSIELEKKLKAEKGKEIKIE
ncbi:archaeal heat shock protein Hsp20 [Methanothrix harundinacea]|uniref:Heat shock protein Hsp20 n=1 Tax=Methanothrix harundinacea (strain 6Ac) TaxID=1110509 RepID=G7WLT1_METH6|nr:archaeal heat shock protein Hsp20 [Methanothrix harundinacea]AET63674.1 Heat shock protein Hsp20 [Methanothrix harundinacea 6Ac]